MTILNVTDFREYITQRMIVQTGELIVVPKDQQWLLRGVMIVPTRDYLKPDEDMGKKRRKLAAEYGDLVIDLQDRPYFRAPALSLMDAWWARFRFDEQLGTSILTHFMDIAEAAHARLLPLDTLKEYAAAIREANEEYMKRMQQIAPSLASLPVQCLDRTALKLGLYKPILDGEERLARGGEPIQRTVEVELWVNVRRQVI